MKDTAFVLAGCVALAFAGSVQADVINFSAPSGLAGQAEFTMIDGQTFQIRLANTSTSVPVGFDSADQLLTGISFDIGLPGSNASDPVITGGTAVIGTTSQSVNFSTGSYGPGQDLGGEWGYGNSGGSGAMNNAISGNTAGVVAFGGPNLDGPASLNGPQGGLVASPALVSLGGLGAIQNEILIEFTLDSSVSGLSDIIGNGARIEFGSDAAFIDVPAPAGAPVLAGLCLVVARRRRA